MRKRLAAAVAAAALVVLPVTAAPAAAEETHVCNVFAPPYDDSCRTALRIFCMLVRDNPICR